MSQAQYGQQQQQQYDQQQQQYGQQQQQQYDQQQPYIQPAQAQAPDAPYEYQAENGAIMVYDPSNGMSYTPEQYQQMLQPQTQYQQPPQQQAMPQHAMPQNQWGEPQQPVFGQQQQQQFQGTNPAAYGLSQTMHAQAQMPQQQTPKAPAPAPSRIDPKQIPRPAYSISEPVKFFTRAGACPPPANSNFVCLVTLSSAPFVVLFLHPRRARVVICQCTINSASCRIYSRVSEMSR